VFAKDVNKKKKIENVRLISLIHLQHTISIFTADPARTFPLSHTDLKTLNTHLGSGKTIFFDDSGVCLLISIAMR
jgi:hypothetical protein